jgi:hypothetical protein
MTLHAEPMETDCAAGWQALELDGAQIAMLQRFGYARTEPATDTAGIGLGHAQLPGLPDRFGHAVLVDAAGDLTEGVAVVLLKA